MHFLLDQQLSLIKSLLKNTRVKLVGSATAGLDHLDTNYLHSEEIKWFYSPGCNSSSVVHYVLAAIAHLDKINIISKESNTIGIIGCGSIGSKLHLVLNKLNIKSMFVIHILSLIIFLPWKRLRNVN